MMYNVITFVLYPVWSVLYLCFTLYGQFYFSSVLHEHKMKQFVLQMVYKDFNEMTRKGSNTYSSPKERPHSGGPSSRRGVMGRASSSDTDPYPMMGIGPTDHGPYWNA